MLLNSIGTDHSLWQSCLPHLVENFFVIRTDVRGHGRSSADGTDSSIADLAADVLTVLDDAETPNAFMAGVSLGGMIALQIAADQPQRVSRLAAICTSATMDARMWSERIDLVIEGGMAAIADGAIERFLSERFRAENPSVAKALREDLKAIDPVGYIAAARAIERMCLSERLRDVRCPTLVVDGSLDVSTPFEPHARNLLASLPNASGLTLACGHLPPLECPEDLSAALVSFFESTS
ncbi:alpha/beta fold hydrolase [Tsuneonella dongtanensis]|uniref:alpha/beta fold hydrolase n=1 Tax=Tsuneonella dongtanensis TaxID=692370 RepID=UPI0018DEC8BB|nr:alpha/beta fold hydrolase [Tsuneonella dongtanensis]